MSAPQLGKGQRITVVDPLDQVVYGGWWKSTNLKHAVEAANAFFNQVACVEVEVFPSGSWPSLSMTKSCTSPPPNTTL